ncbi:hypothetical protein FFK22_019195 [Mycobacterium sp. KBS0706]|uniref:VirB3 family type IV secretion system protein n=1 Tax=Mycobacterium sp. KBS0706 TaxID=2578109 RepID=UPI00110FA148|nr:VirB3 family type IV secretion system protein [Mycobacterium sp. KBS0706]TSD87018.1 hypothetical protein FFK22_019195 [Mycobacterium sp. KBS0706]
MADGTHSSSGNIAGNDELRSGSSILGAPAKHLMTFVMASFLLAIGVNTIAGIVLGILSVGGLLVMHRDDPDALDIWIARLRPPWCAAWTIGAKRRPILWIE